MSTAVVAAPLLPSLLPILAVGGLIYLGVAAGVAVIGHCQAKKEEEREAEKQKLEESFNNIIGEYEKNVRFMRQDLYEQSGIIELRQTAQELISELQFEEYSSIVERFNTESMRVGKRIERMKKEEVMLTKKVKQDCEKLEAIFAQNTVEMTDDNQAKIDMLKEEYKRFEIIMDIYEKEKKVKNALKRIEIIFENNRKDIESLGVYNKEIIEKINTLVAENKENGISLNIIEAFEWFVKEAEEIAKITNMSEKKKQLDICLKKVTQLALEHNIAWKMQKVKFEEEKVNIISDIEREELEKIAQYEEEIKYYSELLKQSSETEYKKLEDSLNVPKGNFMKLSVVRDNVKLTYGKVIDEIAGTEIFKKNLEEMAKALQGYSNAKELLITIEEMFEKTIISSAEFDLIKIKFENVIYENQLVEAQKNANAKLAEKVKVSLENIGYTIEKDDDINGKLLAGEVVYIDTKWNNYKIMAKLGETGALATRLVKFVESKYEAENISEYEKQKDLEIGKSWCKDYDLFVKELENAGISLSFDVRKEPEEEGVMYIADKSKMDKFGQKEIEKEMKN